MVGKTRLELATTRPPGGSLFWAKIFYILLKHKCLQWPQFLSKNFICIKFALLGRAILEWKHRLGFGSFTAEAGQITPDGLGLQISTLPCWPYLSTEYWCCICLSQHFASDMCPHAEGVQPPLGWIEFKRSGNARTRNGSVPVLRRDYAPRSCQIKDESGLDGHTAVGNSDGFLEVGRLR